MSSVTRVHVHCELIWGTERTEARGFSSDIKALTAGASEEAHFPLYGFPGADETRTLAAWTDKGLVLFPPPGAAFRPGKGLTQDRALTHDGQPGWLLKPGDQVELGGEDVVLRLTASEEGFRPKVDRTPALTWIVAAILAFVLPLSFLFVSPDKKKLDDYAQKTLAREKAKKLAEEAARPDAITKEQWEKMMQMPPPAADAPAPTPQQKGIRVTTDR